MDLHLALADAPPGSLRRRAEHALREAIRDGRLPPGTRLPSTRALAAELAVSRGVVVEAYAQLAAEGYLLTRRGGGTWVAALACPSPERPAIAAAAAAPHDADRRARPDPHAGAGARHGSGADASAGVTAGGAGPAPLPAMRFDLRPALPALAGFPRSTWLAALSHVLRTAPDARLGYPDPTGVPELRETLAAYLGRVRGVRATAERIVVTAGLRQGLELLWAVLAADGARRIGHERPGWGRVRETVLEAGLTPVPIDVDDEGLVVEQLDRDGGDGDDRRDGAPGDRAGGNRADGGARADRGAGTDRGAAAVVVTPAHQFPTGAVLSARRRAALVGWAERSSTLVVEDDYDAEIRYDRQPIGSLQGLAPELVVHGGSVSKTLAPAVRIGWLVLPPRLVEPVRARQRHGHGAPAPLEQLALARLIERGDLDRHLRRQRHRYRRRREALLDAVAERLPALAIRGAAAGLHVVLTLPPGSDEAAVVAAARARGVAVGGLGHGPAALVAGYANLPESAAGAAVAALGRALDDAAAATGRAAPTARRRGRAG